MGGRFNKSVLSEKGIRNPKSGNDWKSALSPAQLFFSMTWLIRGFACRLSLKLTSQISLHALRLLADLILTGAIEIIHDRRNSILFSVGALYN